MGANSRPVLSIAIPTFNRRAELAKTIEHTLPSVRKFDDVEVFVSDNASADGTAAYLQSVADIENRFRFTVASTNQGFDRNVLASAQGSRGKYVWIVGDHVRIRSDAVPRILREIARRPGVPVMFVNWLSPPLLTGDQELDDADAFLLHLGTSFNFLGAIVADRRRWLETVRNAYLGTGILHMYAALQLAKVAPSVAIHDRLIERSGLGEQASHWSATPQRIRLMYVEIARLLAHAEADLGYDPQVVRACLGRHMVSLPTAILALKAAGVFDTASLAELRPWLERTPPLLLATELAAHLPNTVARILRALSKRLGIRTMRG